MGGKNEPDETPFSSIEYLRIFADEEGCFHFEIKTVDLEAKEFVMMNFKQAKELGAKTIVLFCGACEPTYSNYKDDQDLEVISYT